MKILFLVAPARAASSEVVLEQRVKRQDRPRLSRIHVASDFTPRRQGANQPGGLAERGRGVERSDTPGRRFYELRHSGGVPDRRGKQLQNRIYPWVRNEKRSFQQMGLAPFQGNGA